MSSLDVKPTEYFLGRVFPIFLAAQEWQNKPQENGFLFSAT